MAPKPKKVIHGSGKHAAQQIMKKPCAKGSSGKSTTPLPPTTRPPMPIIDSSGKAPSTVYLCGKIYVASHRKLFRVIRDNSKPSTEHQVKWSSKKPTTSEWRDALAKIEAYANS